MTVHTTLTLTKVGARFGRTASPVLAEIGVTLTGGMLVALVGPNGSGKSTLLRRIAGDLGGSGTVQIEVATTGPAHRGGRVALMPQETGAVGQMTVRETVVLGRLDRLGLRIPADVVADADAVLDGMGLGPLRHRRLGELSGGQRQLVFFAQTLFRDADILLLDEPTAALDLKHQVALLDRVRDHARGTGRLAIAAIHDIGLAARFADRLLCLEKGQLVADGATTDILTPALLRRLYGVEVEIVLGRTGTPAIIPLRVL